MRALPPIARLLAALLLFACVGYVIKLGEASIWDANEAYYVETPREMIERGDYLNPTFNYEARVNKPVLSYWIVAGLYQLFGVSVGVQRLAIAACALIMIGSVFLLARAASVMPLAPLLASLGLAANPRFFMFARRILIDMSLTMLMTVTLTCFALAERYPERRRAWLMAMYVSVGLGVLAKGPVAAVLPALVFLSYLLVHRELGRLTQMMLPAGMVVVAAIVVPYYVALYLESGWTHILSFLVGENVDRFTTLIGPQRRGVWFYLPVVLTDGLPWAVCLPGAMAIWWRDRRVSSGSAETRIRTLLLLWIGTIVGFFSLSQTKQDLYIFPIVGAVVVLGADLVARGLAGAAERTWLRGSLGAAAIVMAAAGVGVLYLFARAGAVYALAGTRTAGVLLLAGGVAIAAAVLFRHLMTAVVLALAVPVAFCWTLMFRVLPSFERYKPVPVLAELVRRQLAPGDVVAHFDVALPSMVFYLEQPIRMEYQSEAVIPLMRSGRTVHLVLPEDRYDELKDRFGVLTCVLGSAETADVKLREILAGQSPPRVMLITTRCL